MDVDLEKDESTACNAEATVVSEGLNLRAFVGNQGRAGWKLSTA